MKSVESEPVTERQTRGGEWLNDYVFWSFYFSQGSPPLQDLLDAYMLSKFSVQKKYHKASVDKIRDRTVAYFTNGNHVSPGFVIDESFAGSEINERYLDIIHSRKKVHINDSLLLDTLNEMIDMEEMRLGLSVDDKRATRTNLDNPRFGKSILLAHLVDGRGAHHEAFDTFFAEARHMLQEDPDTSIMARLDRLACTESQLRGIECRDVAAFFIQHMA